MVQTKTEFSIPGLKFIFGRGGRTFSKVFWISILLISFTGFSFYIYEIRQKWKFSPDFVTIKRARELDDFPLPAVTMCTNIFSMVDYININDSFHRFNHSYFNLHYKYSSNLSDSECQHLAANMHWCNPYGNMIVEKECHNFNEETTNIVKMIENSALPLDKLLGYCTIEFGGGIKDKDCSKMLNRVITDHGICYSFNMQGFKTIFDPETIHDDFKSYRRTKIAKSLIDETLYNAVMDDDHEDIQWTLEKGYFGENPYFPYRAHEGHFVTFKLVMSLNATKNECTVQPHLSVFFHRPNEIITSKHEDYPMIRSNALRRSILIKSTRTSEELRRYSPHLRNCYFEGERKLKFFNSYTKALCELECTSNYTLKKCGCVKFSMPRNKTTRVCGIKEFNCYINIQNDHTGNSLIPCDCHPPCNDVSYSSNYVEVGYSFIHPSLVNELTGMTLTYGTNKGYVEETEIFASYKLQNLIADIGGLLGLFLGCSLLSIVEVCFMIVSCFVGRKSSKNANNDVESIRAMNEFLKNLNMEQANYITEHEEKLSRLNRRMDNIEKSVVLSAE